MKSITEFIRSVSQLSAVSSQFVSIRFRHFDRQVLTVAPFLPRPDVNADARKAEQGERHVRVRRTVATLAIGNYLAVGSDSGIGIHPGELGGGLELSGRREIARPFDMNGSRPRPAALRADGRAVVLAIGPGVENHGLTTSERGAQFVPGCNGAVVARTGPFARPRRSRIASDREPLGDPRIEPAVEHLHRGMAEVLEEPERARGADSGLIVVHDDRR